MIYEIKAIEYNRGYNAAMEKQLHHIDREERRFTAAVAAMQGYIASNSMELYHDNHDDCMKDICESAVKYADALLRELEK